MSGIPMTPKRIFLCVAQHQEIRWWKKIHHLTHNQAQFGEKKQLVSQGLAETARCKEQLIPD